MVRPFLVWLAAFGLLPALGGAPETQLIRPDADWRLQLVVDAPPPEGWTAPGFPDGSWPPLPAGFGAGFYGYDVTATPLSMQVGAAPVRGLAARRAFQVEDPAAIRHLILRVDYEDGLRVWLNGREVARRGWAAGGEIPWEVPPAFRAAGAAELIDLSPEIPSLQPGTNVLAMLVMDASSFGSRYLLSPELRANFVRGPFLQSVGARRAVVVWEAPVPGPGRVVLRAVGGPTADPRVFESSSTGTVHAVSLEGLEPGTRYSYRAAMGDGESRFESPDVEWSTLRESGQVEFVALGDGGLGSVAQSRLSAWIARASPDLVLHLGDIVYPSFAPGRIDLRCFSIYEDWMRRLPMFVTLGNHDVYGGVDAPLSAFWMPTNGVTGTEHFYSFDHGDVHFVSLYVPWFGIADPGLTEPFTDQNPQVRWLAADLASTTRPWKVVMFHQPPRSSGPHATDDYNLDGKRDSDQMKAWLLPLLGAHGVQLVLNGHDHSWERFVPAQGVHCVVSGGGGGFVYPWSQPEPGSAQFHAAFHVTRVRVRDSEMTVEAIGETGDVLDRFSVRRRSSVVSPDFVEAAWNPAAAPLPEPDPLLRVDGNHRGETFTFAGDGLAAVTGSAANLGRLLVEQDADAIRIGLREVMIGDGQTVALFLGGPRLEGIEQLPGSGVGAVQRHPLGALGLRFAGFRPGVVCLLGDEHADATDPDFPRAGAPYAVGQGVFRLDEALSPVRGARLRQFNRSPETPSPVPENNADFIEVRLPRSALGEVHPGESLWVAAVVLTPGGTWENPVWTVDPGYLGRDLRGLSGDLAELEAMEVRLGFRPGLDADSDGLEEEAEVGWGTDPRRADTDGDGLFDGWEVAHELDPTGTAGDHGAAGDPDRDGYTNLEEQRSGTSPRNGAPTLQAELRLASGGMRLEWRGMAGRRYDVEVASSLPGVFGPAGLPGFPRRSEGGLESVPLPPGGPAEPARWFRLREER